MLFNVLAATLLSAASISAAPVEVDARQAPAVEGYSWSVTDWSAGCSRSTCTYGFNISGEAHDPNIPSFSARCDSWAGEGAEYTPCGVNDEGPGNRGVFAKLLAVNETGTGAHIQVSYKWTDLEQANTYYNYTGRAVASYNQFVALPENFTIIPTEAYGVA